jgi:hypothetical protein
MTLTAIEMEIDIQVSFHVHGADLDPDQVTRILQLEPYCAFHRGDTKTYKSGQVSVRKEGYWGYNVRGTDLCTVVDQFIAGLGERSKIMEALPHAEKAEIEIYVLKPPDQDGGGYFVIELTSDQHKALSNYGVLLRISVVMNSRD